MFEVNPLLGRGFTEKKSSLVFSIDKITKLKCRLLQFLFDALMVNLCFSDGGDNICGGE